MPTPEQQAKIEALRRRKPGVPSRMYASYQEKPTWWNPIGPVAKLIDPTVEKDYDATRDLYYSEGIDPMRDLKGTRYEQEFFLKAAHDAQSKRANELRVPQWAKDKYGWK
jgi:hypothetical protein